MSLSEYILVVNSRFQVCHIFSDIGDKIASPVDTNFSEWLLSEISRREWSGADLARRSSLTRQAVNNYLNGTRRNPDENALQAIAHAFGYPPEVLFRAKGEHPTWVLVFLPVSPSRLKTDFRGPGSPFLFPLPGLASSPVTPPDKKIPHKCVLHLLQSRGFPGYLYRICPDWSHSPQWQLQV
jgi:transcriptional regulator with XRE-family HTH domain